MGFPSGVHDDCREPWKMRDSHCDTIMSIERDEPHGRTWKMARNSENVKNEKYTLYDLEYGEKTENLENETHTL